MEYRICEMKESDWEQVARIYKEGIDTKIATFESEAPSWEKWDRDHTKCCRLVAKTGDTVLGWAALTPYSTRKVYCGVAEVSLYVGKEYKGRKLGTYLLEQLIKLSEAHGYWTLQSTIIKENTPSLKLHKKCGFREVGIREKLARMDNGELHDVYLVEHRSKNVLWD